MENVSATEWMPPSSPTVSGLKFVDEQTPPGPQVKLLYFVGESFVPPVTAGTRATSHDAGFAGSTKHPPLAAVDFSSRFEPHVR